MAIRSLGKVTVTTGGTEVRATSNESSPTARLGCQSIFIQALAANTGDIYVGASGLDRTTLAGVYAILPASTASSYPSVCFELSNSPAGINANEIWIDAEVNGEGVLVSITEQ